jgi:hypothetical protein
MFQLQNDMYLPCYHPFINKPVSVYFFYVIKHSSLVREEKNLCRPCLCIKSSGFNPVFFVYRVDMFCLLKPIKVCFPFCFLGFVHKQDTSEYYLVCAILLFTCDHSRAVNFSCRPEKKTCSL